MKMLRQNMLTIYEKYKDKEQRFRIRKQVYKTKRSRLERNRNMNQKGTRRAIS